MAEAMLHIEHRRRLDVCLAMSAFALNWYLALPSQVIRPSVSLLSSHACMPALQAGKLCELQRVAGFCLIWTSYRCAEAVDIAHRTIGVSHHGWLE